MKKIIFLFVVLLLVGLGCNKKVSVTQVEVGQINFDDTSTISDAEMFKVGAITTSSVSGLSTYTNDSYGISLDFPSSWKMQEYVGPNGIEGIAFDPEIVSTQTEYASVDKAPGRVWIYFSGIDVVEGAVGAESFEKVTIGKEKISVRVLENDCVEPNCPNPWWINRTGRTYYIEFPSDKKTEQLNHIVLGIQYPIALKSDIKVQQELDKMLDSFSFVTSTVR